MLLPFTIFVLRSCNMPRFVISFCPSLKSCAAASRPARSLDQLGDHQVRIGGSSDFERLPQVSTRGLWVWVCVAGKGAVVKHKAHTPTHHVPPPTKCVQIYQCLHAILLPSKDAQPFRSRFLRWRSEIDQNEGWWFNKMPHVSVSF